VTATVETARSFGVVPAYKHRARTAGLIVVGLVSVATTVAAVSLTHAHWQQRYGTVNGWTQGEWTFFVAGWLSVALGQLVGLYLWVRAPRNPTGRWLWLAGFTLGLWFVGTYWPSRWGAVVALGVFAFRPALAFALLGWPTGRPSRELRRWILLYAVTYLVIGLLIGLWAGGDTGSGWPANPLAPMNVAWVGQVFNPMLSWLMQAVPAVALIVVLVRRRQSLPPSSRRLLDPVVVAGVVIAASDLVTVVLWTLATVLLFDEIRGHETPLGVLTLTVNYGQVGMAAIGLLVASGRRRRMVRVADRRLAFDLGPESHRLEPREIVQRSLGLDGADVVYPPFALAASGRQGTPVMGEDGEVVATIETDVDDDVAPSLLAMACRAVAACAANERATAEARSRRTELVELQYALLDATDSDRRRVERDLHDGAQQTLVGLLLSVQLAVRAGQEVLPMDTAADVRAGITQLEDLVSDHDPAVDRGLASGLSTLAATSPVPTHLTLNGDLSGDDPLARVTWFLASEASANALKHADATAIAVELSVEPTIVRLRVADDGNGGVAETPRAIAERVRDADGRVSLCSPFGGGTELIVELPRIVELQR
jgi:signal transduction histidine kinase